MSSPNPAIIGWGHSKFGTLQDRSIEDLMVEVTRQALATSGIAAGDVDAIYVGHFNAGMVSDAFISSLTLAADRALRFTPATRVENACASGSAAIYCALDALRAGSTRIALVVGVEKMSGLSTSSVAAALAGAGYQQDAHEAGVSFPQVFAQYAQSYFERYGDQSDVLAKIAAKNHSHALDNQWAQLRKEIGFTFCNTVSDKNPMIAAPLRLTDCSLISDGAAALVLASGDVAATFDKAVAFRATAQVNDFLPLAGRDLLAFEGPQRAFSQSYAKAGINVSDLDFAEVHDCFTIAELMIYEAMGLAKPGHGREPIEDGSVLKTGSLPINLSGGLKAKGHPVGATGVSMHTLAFLQLTGQAGAMQRDGAQIGAVFNMGGAAVANYVSILEALKS